LLRQVLEELPEEDVLGILPDTKLGLEALVNLGRDSMDDYLKNWQAAQAVRLKHLQFQLTGQQLESVEEALARLMPEASNGHGSSPNVRGTALYLLCRKYLEMNGSL
jgi:ParB family chromosome partitioning protein